MPFTREDIRESVERAGDAHWKALRDHHEDAYPASRPTPGDVCKAEAERLNEMGLGGAKEFELVDAVDLSRAAIRAARERLQSGGAGVRFVVADATALPFEASRFDVVVMSDGLHSWQLPAAERRAALVEAGYVVRAGGHAVLTEYLQPRAFAEFVSEVRAGPFQVVAVEYLPDRLWYRVESWFKVVRDWRWVERLFASVPVARLLGRVARLFGRRGSRHICVVARRQVTEYV